MEYFYIWGWTPVLILILYAVYKQNRFYYCFSCKKKTLHNIINADKKIEKSNSICIHYEKHDGYKYSPNKEPLKIEKGWDII
jgi:hypothetical protein